MNVFFNNIYLYKYTCDYLMFNSILFQFNLGLSTLNLSIVQIKSLV